jgi:intracellular sulfur oxidation DsrE/DsrF family protein
LRHIDRSRVIPEAKIVPSGVAEIGRLESKEGYVYLKP